jgi:hypothetical protein
LEEVLAASPIIQALSASVARSREALDVAAVSLAEAGPPKTLRDTLSTVHES